MLRRHYQHLLGSGSGAPGCWTSWSTEDGARLVDSGVQGVHWDYDENGVPMVEETVLQDYMELNAGWFGPGAGDGVFSSITGPGVGESTQTAIP